MPIISLITIIPLNTLFKYRYTNINIIHNNNNIIVSSIIYSHQLPFKNTSLWQGCDMHDCYKAVYNEQGCDKIVTILFTIHVASGDP